MDIGRHLKENRERRGITLGQIARSTKLSTTTLRYIERNDFGRLPGGIFIRGYLRAFAAEVGANPHHVVRAYIDQLPLEPVVDEQQRHAREAVAANRLVVGVITAGITLLFTLMVYGPLLDSPKRPAAGLPVLEARPLLLYVEQAVAASPPPATESPKQGLRPEMSAEGKVHPRARRTRTGRRH